MLDMVNDQQRAPLNWPPDYAEEYNRRTALADRLSNNRDLQVGVMKHYAQHCADWINDWAVTHDPRAEEDRIMPFVLFPRQEDFVEFIVECLTLGENALVEKCRDIGATWICCAISVWIWLFWDGAAVGWGSRKAEYVDKLGDPKTIFEKIRMIVDKLPSWMLPAGYNPTIHSTFMKLINPENGATIVGESGDNIGRGGRTTIYFKDESAHYERPEMIEAALGDNTNVQIDISSVNGTGNVFHRRRKSGVIWERGKEIAKGMVRVFIFDWRHHPAKDQEWYDTRRAKAEREGLTHKFAQEVDRDYSASVEGIIIPAKWVKASIDAHLRPELGIKTGGERIAGFDVCDNGGDANSVARREGIILRAMNKWAFAEDIGISTQEAVRLSIIDGITEFYYDCIGMGAGVKSETNRLAREGILPRSLRVMPWNASLPPLQAKKPMIPSDPKSPLIGEVLENMKAQAWWELRVRFEKTYKAITYGIKYDPSELISIDSTMEYLEELLAELSQPVWKKYTKSGKMQVDKKPDGTKSPNLADAVVMCYLPTRQVSILDVI